LMLMLFVVSHAINLPPQFFAHTTVTTESMVQDDLVWVDQINNMMKTIYNFGLDDSRTLIYRGDLRKEFYYHDGICGFIDAPDKMDFNLQLPENVTFRGEKIVDGVLVQLFYYEFAFNSVVNYYFKIDGTPFRFQFLSGSETRIDFIEFSTNINQSVFDLPKMDCQPITVDGVNNRHDYLRHLRVLNIDSTKMSPISSGTNLVENNFAIDPTTLILIGKTVWSIIQDNKPVSNLDTILNAIIPDGANWTDMSGWRQQKWNEWQWNLNNAYGVTTVSYRWGFAFLCEGQYNDIGSYIENAGVFPENINVLWGYNVNVKTSLANPFNAGSTKSPVAGITLTMTMETSTIISNVVQKCTVNLKGDCTTEVINCSGYKISEKFLYF